MNSLKHDDDTQIRLSFIRNSTSHTTGSLVLHYWVYAHITSQKVKKSRTSRRCWCFIETHSVFNNTSWLAHGLWFGCLVHRSTS